MVRNTQLPSTVLENNDFFCRPWSNLIFAIELYDNFYTIRNKKKVLK